MKRFACLAVTAMALLLGGCATTIRSDVTTFQQWPATIADKSFAFEAPAAQEDTLEYRSYQDLVRGELKKLGFNEASGKPALMVSMRFATVEQPIRVLEVRDPFFMSVSQQMYLRQGPFTRWHRGFYPFYDPFWSRPVVVGEDVENVYQRQLQVAIKGADGKRLFDVTVQNVSKEASTPLLIGG